MSKKKETTPTDTPKNGAAPKAVGKAANEAIAYAEQAGVAKAKGEAPEPGKAGEAAPSVVVVPQAEGRPAAKGEARPGEAIAHAAQAALEDIA